MSRHIAAYLPSEQRCLEKQHVKNAQIALGASGRCIQQQQQQSGPLRAHNADQALPHSDIAQRYKKDPTTKQSIGGPSFSLQDKLQIGGLSS